MDFSFVAILPVENDTNSFYRAKILRSGNSISLTIFDNSCAYKGEMTSEYITTRSKACKLSENQYVEECRKAFQNSQSSEFTYSIADDYFYLKKSIQRNTSSVARIKFADIKLEKVDFQTFVVTVLDSTLDENKQYLKKIEELQSANEALLNGNELLLEQLNQLQNAKNSMESVLYYRFLNLLNSKKNKLRELKKISGEAMDEETSEIDDEMELDDGVPQNAYDIDTDVDEEVKITKDVLEPAKVSVALKPSCNEYTEMKTMKNEQNAKDNLKPSKNTTEENSKTPSIFERMSILDPTIPFVS